MLLKKYRKEIFKSKCDSGAQGVQCFAHLENDVSGALPYLNSTLGGFAYTKNPPSVTFKVYGKLITVHARKIAVNALKDEEEAEKIISWLQKEINDVWDRRDEIEPNYQSVRQPVVFEVLKLLPRTNCKKCSEPTCMVFAVRVTEGIKDQNNCPAMDTNNKRKLEEYLAQFQFGSFV